MVWWCPMCGSSVELVSSEVWEAFQSPVEVFWIEVQPIWNTTQELMDWSRICSRELSCRNILVHEITMIVNVHFTIFIAVNGRQTRNWSFVYPESHIGIDIVYDIVYDIEDAQIPGSLATRYWHDIERKTSNHQRNAGASDFSSAGSTLQFGMKSWTRIGGSCLGLLPIPPQCQISTEKNMFVK